MDFRLDEAQETVRDLGARILGGQVTNASLDTLDAAGEWFDRSTWRELADAGLLGIALPEEHGGGGLTFLELHLLLEQVGAHVAQVPAWETLVLGALPIAAFGTEQQRARLLPGVVAGEVTLSGALGTTHDPDVVATPDGDHWRLNGSRSVVPLAPLVDHLVVAGVTSDGDEGLHLLDADSEGLSITAGSLTGGWPAGTVELADAPAEALGIPGDGAPAWLRERALAGLASLQSGVCTRAVERAAAYTSEREQFGRPVATFQAVGHRVADAYIDAEAVRLTALQAAWRLAEGLAATDEVTIAKWWAAEAGHRVLYGVHHVHGGVGVDHSYGLHRYFGWAKRIEFTLGSGTDQLLSLGRTLAAEPA
ncbi:MAG: acyl-CoA/acyl-ACP dehydrogenase [Actinobacteria bacterium]|nr:acyl-CoA/acyl-ACP dehydrogenase [Actinomycetota bacterium]